MPDARIHWSSLVRMASALLLVAVGLFATIVVPADRADAALVRPFTQVFSAQTNGSLQVTGNTMLTCGTALACTQPRTGRSPAATTTS